MPGSWLIRSRISFLGEVRKHCENYMVLGTASPLCCLSHHELQRVLLPSAIELNHLKPSEEVMTRRIKREPDIHRNLIS